MLIFNEKVKNILPYFTICVYCKDQRKYMDDLHSKRGYIRHLRDWKDIILEDDRDLSTEQRCNIENLPAEALRDEYIFVLNRLDDELLGLLLQFIRFREEEKNF